MDLIWEGFAKAFELITTGDPGIFEISLLTLRVSFTAILISTILGIPLGIILGLTRFPGRKLILILFNIGMGLPPVIAGLTITMLLWRSGPLGDYALLYTPTAIVLAQILVSFPIVVGLTSSSFQQIDEKMLLQIKALGATKIQTLMDTIKRTTNCDFSCHYGWIWPRHCRGGGCDDGWGKYFRRNPYFNDFDYDGSVKRQL